MRVLLKIGIDILSRALDQVPSALAGLTSLFGMGRGDPRRYRHHKVVITYLKKDTSIKVKEELDAHNRKLTGN